MIARIYLVLEEYTRCSLFKEYPSNLDKIFFLADDRARLSFDWEDWKDVTRIIMASIR